MWVTLIFQTVLLSLFRISVSILWLSLFSKEPSENFHFLLHAFDPCRWRLYWTKHPPEKTLVLASILSTGTTHSDPWSFPFLSRLHFTGSVLGL